MSVRYIDLNLASLWQLPESRFKQDIKLTNTNVPVLREIDDI
jgi:hypothetical protein